MRARLWLLVAVLAASALVLGLVTLGEADAWACMDWDGGLHVGYDDPARPFSTTWAVFLGRVEAWLEQPGRGLPVLLESAAPFAATALGAVFAPRPWIPGLWIGLALSVAASLFLLGDPSAQHDCDRKGSDAMLGVVLFGPLAGLFWTILGVLAGHAIRRR